MGDQVNFIVTDSNFSKPTSQYMVLQGGPASLSFFNKKEPKNVHFRINFLRIRGRLTIVRPTCRPTKQPKEAILHCWCKVHLF